eukprot:14430161-Ditylum_brightwellii.AAC.1
MDLMYLVASGGQRGGEARLPWINHVATGCWPSGCRQYKSNASDVLTSTSQVTKVELGGCKTREGEWHKTENKVQDGVWVVEGHQ